MERRPVGFESAGDPIKPSSRKQTQECTSLGGGYTDRGFYELNSPVLKCLASLPPTA